MLATLHEIAGKNYAARGAYDQQRLLAGIEAGVLVKPVNALVNCGIGLLSY